MAARAYFAWKMVMAAKLSDEKNTQSQFQAHLRHEIGSRVKNVSDSKFSKLYRLTKDAFEDLCELLRKHTDLKSSQRVSLESKVLCALLFYAHGDYQRVVGEANNFSQEAISIYVDEVTNALNHPRIVNTFIKFPTTRLERDAIKQSFSTKYGIPGVIGCIDGSHFKIFTPRKDIEHLYYCRKDYHSLNVQMVCDADYRILAVNPKFGGAKHDAFIWENSYVNNFMQKLHRDNELVWLLGDSGYPQRPWIMTPYADAAPGSIEELYNDKHSVARVVIENTFARLKNRWRCVCKDRVLHYKPTKCAKIITACCVLHNIALKYNVPDPDEPVEVSQEIFLRQEVVEEGNEAARDLLMGRALRNQLARRLTE